MTDFSKMELTALSKMLAEKQEALRVFRFSGAGGRARDTRMGRGLRKEIAQLMTEINKQKVAQSVINK